MEFELFWNGHVILHVLTYVLSEREHMELIECLQL